MSTEAPAAPPPTAPAPPVAAGTPAAKPAPPKKKTMFEQMFTVQNMLILGLMGLFFGIPILVALIETMFRYNNPGFAIDFAEFGGGPTLLDRNLVPPFAMGTNLPVYAAAFERMSFWSRAEAISFVFLFLLTIAQLFMAIKDNIQGWLGKKAPDVGATVALLMIPLAFVINVPILAAAILIACLPLIVRDRTGKSPWWIAPTLAFMGMILIIAIGNRYLLWPSTGAVGYYRVLAHFLMNLGENNGFWLHELLKFGALAYLFASPNRDGSGMINVYLGTATTTIFLERVVFSGMYGSFYATEWNGVYWYTTFQFVIAGIIVMREVFRPGTKAKADAKIAKKANPLSVMNTFMHLAMYAGQTMLVHAAAINYLDKRFPPILSIVIGLLWVGLIEGWDEFITNAMPGVAIDFAKYHEAIGDAVNIGPLKFWASDVELIIYTIYGLLLYVPTALSWFTEPAAVTFRQLLNLI